MHLECLFCQCSQRTGEISLNDFSFRYFIMCQWGFLKVYSNTRNECTSKSERRTSDPHKYIITWATVFYLFFVLCPQVMVGFCPNNIRRQSAAECYVMCWRRWNTVATTNMNYSRLYLVNMAFSSCVCVRCKQTWWLKSTNTAISSLFQRFFFHSKTDGKENK